MWGDVKLQEIFFRCASKIVVINVFNCFGAAASSYNDESYANMCAHKYTSILSMNIRMWIFFIQVKLF